MAIAPRRRVNALPEGAMEQRRQFLGRIMLVVHRFHFPFGSHTPQYYFRPSLTEVVAYLKTILFFTQLCCLLAMTLQSVKARVQPVLGEQFGMVANLGDTAPVEHDDSVGAFDGR